MDLRTSLLKVDGFNEPGKFEKFVTEVNINANLLLKEKNPIRFKSKYSDNIENYDFRGHQT